jgi:hypothetical protein
MGNFRLAVRAIILNFPVNITPFINAQTFAISIGAGLRVDAFHEESLEARHSKEGD